MSKQKQERIHRAQHDADNQYFLKRRATSQDRALTYEARGMLDYLLSKPSNWVLQPKELQQPGCGRDKVYRILNELIEHRYIDRIYLRNESNQVISVDYEVYECPFPEKPDTENPDTAKPDTENTHSTKERSSQITESLQITESTDSQPASAVANDEPIQLDEKVAKVEPSVEPLVKEGLESPSKVAEKVSLVTRVVNVQSQMWKDAPESERVYIGRNTHPGFIDQGWGNPHKVNADGTRDEVIAKYRADLVKDPVKLAKVRELRGKALGCWCKAKDANDVDLACHGDVLAELASLPDEQLQKLIDKAIRDRAHDAIADLCYGAHNDYVYKMNGSLIGKVYKQLSLVEIPLTAERVNEFGRRWYKNDWRGQKKQKPDWKQVISEWTKLMLSESEETPETAPVPITIVRDESWQVLMNQLRTALNQNTYQTYIEQMVLADVSKADQSKTYFVQVKNQYFRDEVKRRFLNEMTSRLIAISNLSTINIEFEVVE